MELEKHIGWQCPGCGRCYAPFVTMCSQCPIDKVTATPVQQGDLADIVRDIYTPRTVAVIKDKPPPGTEPRVNKDGLRCVLEERRYT